MAHETPQTSELDDSFDPWHDPFTITWEEGMRIIEEYDWMQSLNVEADENNVGEEQGANQIEEDAAQASVEEISTPTPTKDGLIDAQMEVEDATRESLLTSGSSLQSLICAPESKTTSEVNIHVQGDIRENGGIPTKTTHSESPVDKERGTEASANTDAMDVDKTLAGRIQTPQKEISLEEGPHFVPSPQGNNHDTGTSPGFSKGPGGLSLGDIVKEDDASPDLLLNTNLPVGDVEILTHELVQMDTNNQNEATVESLVLEGSPQETPANNSSPKSSLDILSSKTPKDIMEMQNGHIVDESLEEVPNPDTDSPSQCSPNAPLNAINIADDSTVPACRMQKMVSMDNDKNEQSISQADEMPANSEVEAVQEEHKEHEERELLYGLEEAAYSASMGDATNAHNASDALDRSEAINESIEKDEQTGNGDSNATSPPHLYDRPSLFTPEDEKATVEHEPPADSSQSETEEVGETSLDPADTRQDESNTGEETVGEATEDFSNMPSNFALSSSDKKAPAVLETTKESPLTDISKFLHKQDGDGPVLPGTPPPKADTHRVDLSGGIPSSGLKDLSEDLGPYVEPPNSGSEAVFHGENTALEVSIRSRSSSSDLSDAPSILEHSGEKAGDPVTLDSKDVEADMEGVVNGEKLNGSTEITHPANTTATKSVTPREVMPKKSLRSKSKPKTLSQLKQAHGTKPRKPSKSKKNDKDFKPDTSSDEEPALKKRRTSSKTTASDTKKPAHKTAQNGARGAKMARGRNNRPSTDGAEDVSEAESDSREDAVEQSNVAVSEGIGDRVKKEDQTEAADEDQENRPPSLSKARKSPEEASTRRVTRQSTSTTSTPIPTTEAPTAIPKRATRRSSLRIATPVPVEIATPPPPPSRARTLSPSDLGDEYMRRTTRSEAKKQETTKPEVEADDTLVLDQAKGKATTSNAVTPKSVVPAKRKAKDGKSGAGGTKEGMDMDGEREREVSPLCKQHQTRRASEQHERDTNIGKRLRSGDQKGRMST